MGTIQATPVSYKAMRPSPAPVLLALLVVVCMPAPLAACMCAEPPAAAKMFQRSESVFVGTVVRHWFGDMVSYVGRLRLLQPLLGYRRINFEIHEVLRCPRRDRITVLADFVGSTFEFLPGERYRVYAVRDENSERLFTSACFRTVPYA